MGRWRNPGQVARPCAPPATRCADPSEDMNGVEPGTMVDFLPFNEPNGSHAPARSRNRRRRCRARQEWPVRPSASAEVHRRRCSAQHQHPLRAARWPSAAAVPHTGRRRSNSRNRYNRLWRAAPCHFRPGGSTRPDRPRCTARRRTPYTRPRVIARSCCRPTDAPCVCGLSVAPERRRRVARPAHRLRTPLARHTQRPRAHALDLTTTARGPAAIPRTPALRRGSPRRRLPPNTPFSPNARPARQSAWEKRWAGRGSKQRPFFVGIQRIGANRWLSMRACRLS